MNKARTKGLGINAYFDAIADYIRRVHGPLQHNGLHKKGVVLGYIPKEMYGSYFEKRGKIRKSSRKVKVNGIKSGKRRNTVRSHTFILPKDFQDLPPLDRVSNLTWTTSAYVNDFDQHFFCNVTKLVFRYIVEEEIMLMEFTFDANMWHPEEKEFTRVIQNFIF